MTKKSKYKKWDDLNFKGIIFIELITLPILYIFNYFKNIASSKKSLKIKKLRSPVLQERIYVNIHEWGGYESKRFKNSINKLIVGFECGLHYQLTRYKNQNINREIELSVTISDAEKYRNLELLKNEVNKIIFVSNDGMDFSGYSTLYSMIKDLPNAYVILTNSSVNALQDDFLEEYINYMEKNPDVGIFGTSYCTKIYQSLIKNNFHTHLQSFFLLTTTEVLKEIVEANKNIFPGKGIKNKLLLIRKGEIKISEIAKNLGYNLAVVIESGKVYKFGKNSLFDNGHNNWILQKGDMRIHVKNPNKMNPIKSEYK